MPDEPAEPIDVGGLEPDPGDPGGFPERGPLPGDERSPSSPVTMRAALAYLATQALTLLGAFGLDLTKEQVLAVNGTVGAVLLVLVLGFPKLDRVSVAGKTLWTTAAGKVAPVNDGIDPDYDQAEHESQRR